MMKLLLISWVLFWIFLAGGPEKAKAMPGKEIPLIEEALEVHHFSHSSKVAACQDEITSSVWRIKVLNPVKQLDLPGDMGKGWCNVVCRILRPGFRQELGGRCCHLHGGQFLCFLAGRHLHGFYIYSLEKLII